MTQPDLPHTEQALLGALLLNPTLIPQITHTITPTDFADPRHTTIYTTTLHIAPLNPPGPIDPITLAQALAHGGHLKHGWLDGNYLHDCLTACTNPLSAPTWAATIRHHANNRTITTIAARLHQLSTTDTWLNTTPEQQHAALTAAATELADTLSNTRGLNGRHPNLNPAHLYRIKAMNWLWDNRIPLGTLTLISGREGVGKSILLAWLTAAITNGNLPGDLHKQRRAVLIAATEDSWEYTITPRLLAAGANLDLVYRLDIAEPDGTHQPINLPHDIPHLHAAVTQTGAAALLCDPLLSVIDDTVNVFKAREVRTVLEPLTAAAEQARIAIIGLAHYNKARHADSNSMIANSRAFVEVARTVIAVARDEDADEYTCVLTQTKNNVGPLDLPSLLYTIDDVVLETEDGEEAHVGRLRWTGEAEVTADQLLTGTAGDRELGETSQLILNFVLDHPPPTTVQEVAAHFKDTIKHETVKKTLSRLATKGHLSSPGRGLYQAPGLTGRKTGKQKGRAGTPPYPRQTVSLVPNSHSSPYIYSGGGGGKEDQTGEEGVSPEVSLGTQEVSLDTDQNQTQDHENKGQGHKRHPLREVSPEVSPDPVPEPPEDDREPWWHR